jgi:predicted PurR-regulated permease PerM
MKIALEKNSRILFRTAAILLVLVLLFYALVKAQAFLAPLVTAVVLALVILPLSRKMEKSISRGWAAFWSSFFLFLCSLGFVALVSLQVKSFIEDWPQTKQKIQPKIENAQSFIVQNSPLDKKDLKIFDEGQKSSAENSTGNSSQGAGSILSKLVSFFGNYLLTFIYVFFLLTYRKRFKNFLLNIFPNERRQEVKETINSSARVAPRYLGGKLILMGILAVVYSIGLGVSGVNNFIMVSLIAALLTLIPYIGNIIGFFLAVALGFLTTGSTITLVGITITFVVAQFIESYVLEPYLLGKKVDVHPFFVILVVVIGNLLWGVVGMVLAIPLMGIITIIFLHIKPLQPLGLLFSKKDMPVSRQ